MKNTLTEVTVWYKGELIQKDGGGEIPEFNPEELVLWFQGPLKPDFKKGRTYRITGILHGTLQFDRHGSYVGLGPGDQKHYMFSLITAS